MGEMIKAPVTVQELRRRIYRKAKSDKDHRFWGIFVHVTKIEVLREAYRTAKRNGGAPGIDRQSFDDIEAKGLESFLAEIRYDLRNGKYQPQPNRRVDIPKSNGKTRTLQIPCIRDRVVQGALKLILEAIFEADFCTNSYGFRPKRSPHRALAEVASSAGELHPHALSEPYVTLSCHTAPIRQTHRIFRVSNVRKDQAPSRQIA